MHAWLGTQWRDTDFEQQGFSWAYWEWNSGFGIYNPKTGQYLQRLVDALISDPMPEAEAGAEP